MTTTTLKLSDFYIILLILMMYEFTILELQLINFPRMI